VDQPRRVLIYGVTGSGKTTMAHRVADRLGLPCHEVDELTWRPGWVEVPGAEQRARIAAICAGDRWVLDTAYGAWADLPLATADLVVGLDYARWRSLWRLLRRSAVRVATREPVCNGNVETLRNMIARDSILVWHFRSFRRKRQRMRRWAADPDGPPLVLLRSPRAAEAWLATLGPVVPVA
jgi:adenylate kinase family enzyme